jgi:ubiquinone biosynthesis protein UbiJ
LPPASIDRTEYDLKQQWFEDHIDDLEEDVKDLQQHVEKLSDKLANKKDR